MSKEKNIEKEKKQETKKGNNKKFIILGVVVILAVLIAIALVLIFNKDDKDLNDIQVSNLTYVVPLKKEDAAKAENIIRKAWGMPLENQEANINTKEKPGGVVCRTC